MVSKRKNKLKETYERAKLDYKKEMIKLLIVNILFIAAGSAIYILSKQILAVLGMTAFLAAIDYLLISRPSQIIKKEKERLENEFVHVFVYFGLFVKNGRPVYNALEDCLRYCSDSLSEKIRKLLEDIDEDKTITPYMNFAKNFQNLEIKQVLISVYKMSIEGGGEEYLNQFDTLFTALSNAKRAKLIENEKSNYGNFNFLPMLASALSMGIIAVAVVVLMEGYTNVI